MPRRGAGGVKRTARDEEPGNQQDAAVVVESRKTKPREEKRRRVDSDAANANVDVDSDENWEDMNSSAEEADYDEDGFVNEESNFVDDEEIVARDMTSDDEDEEDYEDDEEDDDDAQDSPSGKKRVAFEGINDDEDDDPANDRKIWRRDKGDRLDEEQELQYSNVAYDSFFQLRTEFPCLSFDVLQDNDGACRTKYPLSMYLVCGTQCESAAANQLVVLKVTNLVKTKNDDDDEEDDDDRLIGMGDDTSSDEDEEAEEVNNGEPLVYHRTVKHHGTINRLRCCPQNPTLTATWSDAGNVQIFDLANEAHSLADFANWSREEAAAMNKGGKKSALRFISSASTHTTEGYGLAWNRLENGILATGDCYGQIFVWRPSESRWAVAANTTLGNAPSPSVEEITWSPTESNVFIAARSGGHVEVWDTREMSRPKIVWRADPTDINVADWNKATDASHLVATGADSGFVSIWDLRRLQTDGPAMLPLQQLGFHEGNSITSVEFSEHNESCLSVTSNDGQCTLWDLSLERDEGEERELVGELFGRGDISALPDQLMFQHQGLKLPKEAHFHSQIPGMTITTDYNGLHLFKPMNWKSLMK